jgi:hypothetical protein
MGPLLCLDRNLGDFSGPERRELTGYDVPCWLEQNPERLPSLVEIVTTIRRAPKNRYGSAESLRLVCQPFASQQQYGAIEVFRVLLLGTDPHSSLAQRKPPASDSKEGGLGEYQQSRGRDPECLTTALTRAQFLVLWPGLTAFEAQRVVFVAGTVDMPCKKPAQ